ncbi:hypothetical protein FB45DRAFT_885825 [Roridomyces roridus]|uniref:Secreted protein n=1 Tax=Roridomyces roridus TaxID=1738132 RepID=A0AAD7G1V4_9AGAR|nr:hypothetical protein FB45DRAFT_885825 [Roridomyces roridus]
MLQCLCSVTIVPWILASTRRAARGADAASPPIASMPFTSLPRRLGLDTAFRYLSLPRYLARSSTLPITLAQPRNVHRSFYLLIYHSSCTIGRSTPDALPPTSSLPS